jgi:hypothetical protein
LERDSVKKWEDKILELDEIEDNDKKYFLKTHRERRK